MEAVRPVYEDSVLSAFYNGCVVAVVRSVLALLPTGQCIVALEVGAGMVDGALDEVMIFNRALSGAEVPLAYAAFGARGNEVELSAAALDPPVQSAPVYLVASVRWEELATGAAPAARIHECSRTRRILRE